MDVLGLLESDDRVVKGKTDKLKDSAKVIEDYVNSVIKNGKNAGLTGKELSRYVFEALGKDVPNSGVTLAGKKDGNLSNRTRIAFEVEKFLYKFEPVRSKKPYNGKMARKYGFGH